MLALTICASLSAAFRPIHGALYRLENYERAQQSKAAEERRAAELAHAERQKVLDAARELQRRMDAAWQTFSPVTEPDWLQATEQASRILTGFRTAKIMELPGANGYSLDQIRRLEPCFDLNSISSRSISPERRPSVQNLCLAAVAQFNNEDGRHTSLIAFFVEQLPIYANWRDQQGISRRYPQQHMAAYWRARALQFRQGAQSPTPDGMIDLGFFSSFAEPAFATLSQAERQYLLTTIQPQSLRFAEAARAMAGIRDEHRKLSNPPLLVEE